MMPYRDLIVVRNDIPSVLAVVEAAGFVLQPGWPDSPVYQGFGVDLRWFGPPPEPEELGFQCQFLVTMNSSDPLELDASHPFLKLLAELAEPHAVCCEGEVYHRLNEELLRRGVLFGILKR